MEKSLSAQPLSGAYKGGEKVFENSTVSRKFYLQNEEKRREKNAKCLVRYFLPSNVFSRESYMPGLPQHDCLQVGPRCSMYQ